LNLDEVPFPRAFKSHFAYAVKQKNDDKNYLTPHA